MDEAHEINEAATITANKPTLGLTRNFIIPPQFRAQHFFVENKSRFLDFGEHTPNHLGAHAFRAPNNSDLITS